MFPRPRGGYGVFGQRTEQASQTYHELYRSRLARDPGETEPGPY